MNTIRETVIQNLITQLKYIKSTYGYNNTFADAKIIRGRNQIHESELPAILVIPGLENIEKRYSEAVHDMPVEIKAYREFTSSQNPSVLGETLLGDLIINVFNPIYELDFTLGDHEISEGNTITGKISGATSIVTDVTINGGSWATANAYGTLKLRYQDGNYQSELIQVSGIDSATIAGDSDRIYPYGTAVGQVIYDQAGIDISPDPGEKIIEVVLNIRMQYTTAFDNPYV
ncbi:MAG: hypothetical protein ACFFDY_01300 [Candidatus Thorarchaeota archaeon]